MLEFCSADDNSGVLRISNYTSTMCSFQQKLLLKFGDFQ